ncbi:sulfite exporter TauE/SafE family protein [Pseudomonas aeruginosa]|nr:sulfite exporter TauE/SafE family protein [Pseudomonas aeruginosa]
MLGAALVGLASGDFIRLAFVAYLAITILDCLLRRGFLSRAEERQARPLGVGETRLGGTLIGAIATFLGVGGSVMTVPLLRRCGLSMTQATSMANPLSLPVAWRHPYLPGPGRLPGARPGPGFVGYIDLLAFATLAGGGWLGIRLATPLIGRIPDALHARVYVGLLAAVMLTCWRADAPAWVGRITPTALSAGCTGPDIGATEKGPRPRPLFLSGATPLRTPRGLPSRCRQAPSAPG